MKIFITLALSLLLFGACNQPQTTHKFNNEWKFKLLTEAEESSSFHEIIYNDEDWEEVKLPHSAHLEPLVVNNQWQGICWYRKNFKVPTSIKDEKVILEFEAAMNFSQFWINGQKVMEHQGGYLPIVFDATPYLAFGKTNTIAIKLDNRDNLTTGPKPLKRLDFNMYGGLYRNAWMHIENKVNISHPILANKIASGGTFITTPSVSVAQSTVNIKTHLNNETTEDVNATVEYSIIYKDKIIETQKTNTKIKTKDQARAEMTFDIKDAKLWSPDHPNLYKMHTKVYVNDKIMDSEITTFGIRKFAFKGQDLYINGEKTYLRGVNRHQEYPFIGYALSDNAQYRDAEKIKEGGFDYVRLSHYPQSKAFLRACDELGLVVVDAILGWQYYGDNDAFRNYCYSSAKNLIRRDRNHACVLAWEVSLNETQMPIFFMEELDRIVHEEYPGDNVYSCGWMDDVYDIYFQARQHAIMHPNETIEKPYNVSEYGDWEYHSNNAGLNQDKVSRTKRAELSSRQLRSDGEARLLNQAYNIQEAHNDNFRTPAHADGYWVMYDYNRGYHDNIESSGVMDIFRLPKFSYYFYQSQRDATTHPMIKIASYWDERSPLDLTVYSNADRVILSLNGKQIASQKADTGKNCENIAYAPFTFIMASFEAGELKAEAYIGNTKVGEDIVRTPRKATKLKLWLAPSKKQAEAGCNDIIFLYISAVDENGSLINNYDEKIILTGEGDYTVMNTEEIKAEAGVATALIKIGESDAPIHFSANAGELTGKIILDIK